MNKFKNIISIRNVIVIILIIVSLIKLGIVIEAIYSKKVPLYDFKIIYLASQAWMRGLNPYDHNLLINLWEQDGNMRAEAPDINRTPSIYPITTYSILSPLSILPWPKVKILWTIVNVVSFLLIYCILLNLCSLHIGEWRSTLLLSLSILLMPLQQCLILGQPALLATLFLMASLATSISTPGRYIIPGMFFAISVAIKPIIGFPFILYFILGKRWNIIISSVTILATIVILSVIRIGHLNLSWIYTLYHNVNAAFAIGGVNDTSIANNSITYMTNLHPLLHFIIDSDVIINTIRIIIVISVIIILVKNMSIINNRYHNLINISIISLINLLCFYHRGQDAIILMIPLGLIILLMGTQYNKNAYYSILLMIPFYIPLRFLPAAKLWKYYFYGNNNLSWYLKMVVISIINYQSLTICFILIYFLYLSSRIHQNEPIIITS